MDAILNSIPYSEQPAGEPADESGKDSYLQLVPAVDQSIRLLFTLANMVGGEASLTELARQVGISKSKGLAILNTLRHAGLVTRNDRTKNYRLGPNVLLLGRALINNTDIGQEATPFLEELAAQTGCSIHLGVVSGETMFVAARRHAPGGTYIAIDVGQRYPLTWGAHGRAYLATLSPEEFESRLSQSSILQAGETARDAIDRETLRAEVEESRRLGYGTALGTTWSGLNAVSAVMMVDFPEEPGVKRAAGFLVAVGSFSPERAREIGLKTVETAEKLSRELGPLLRAVNLHFPLSRPLLT
ncbi:MAG: IclR family transcriptional regulator [Thermoleophilia bacterium]|nr:IclR family transcriptional regulator [Thermoleophilia bacterium]